MVSQQDVDRNVSMIELLLVSFDELTFEWIDLYLLLNVHVSKSVITKKWCYESLNAVNQIMIKKEVSFCQWHANDTTVWYMDEKTFIHRDHNDYVRPQDKSGGDGYKSDIIKYWNKVIHGLFCFKSDLQSDRYGEHY